MNEQSETNDTNDTIKQTKQKIKKEYTVYFCINNEVKTSKFSVHPSGQFCQYGSTHI